MFWFFFFVNNLGVFKDDLFIGVLVWEKYDLEGVFVGVGDRVEF